jgi:hypothetical protein
MASILDEIDFTIEPIEETKYEEGVPDFQSCHSCDFDEAEVEQHELAVSTTNLPEEGT